jgi:hypothetical protein
VPVDPRGRVMLPWFLRDAPDRSASVLVRARTESTPVVFVAPVGMLEEFAEACVGERG